MIRSMSITKRKQYVIFLLIKISFDPQYLVMKGSLKLLSIAYIGYIKFIIAFGGCGNILLQLCL